MTKIQWTPKIQWEKREYNCTCGSAIRISFEKDTMNYAEISAIFDKECEDFLKVHIGVGHHQCRRDTCSRAFLEHRNQRIVITHSFTRETEYDSYSSGSDSVVSTTYMNYLSRDDQHSQQKIQDQNICVVIGELEFVESIDKHIDNGNGTSACEYRNLRKRSLEDVDWKDILEVENICEECIYEIGQGFLESTQELEMTKHIIAMSEERKEKRIIEQEKRYLDIPDTELDAALISFDNVVEAINENEFSVPDHREAFTSKFKKGQKGEVHDND